MSASEVDEQQTNANVSLVHVSKEDVARAAVSLRRGGISPGGAWQAGFKTAVELAAIVRLQAAGILGLDDRLDAFDDSALASAIAAAPLHERTGYYYFDPEELLAHAAKYQVVRRIEVRLKAREICWQWTR